MSQLHRSESASLLIWLEDVPGRSDYAQGMGFRTPPLWEGGGHGFGIYWTVGEIKRKNGLEAKYGTGAVPRLTAVLTATGVHVSGLRCTAVD